MEEEGRYCPCIRCREIKNETFDKEEVFYKVDYYMSSEGTEYYITANILPRYKNPYLKTLVGFCRLRIPNNQVQRNHFQENLRYSALIRELHVYGQLTPTNIKSKKQLTSQHRGYGSELLKLAEKISYQHGVKKINVISGVGVRGYYQRKHNYKLEKGYMVKYLDYRIPIRNLTFMLMIPLLFFLFWKFLW